MSLAKRHFLCDCLHTNMHIYPHPSTIRHSSYNMARPSPFLFILALTMVVIRMCSAGPTIEELKLLVNNPANGTAGGMRFDRDIGRNVALEIMRDGSEFIWTIFHQQSPQQRKDVGQIILFVESMGGVAYTANDQIHLSAEYVGNYNGDVRREIRGVLYHELTHVWQWNGRGTAPSGLIEGIADYVRLTAGLAPSHWRKPGSGDRWDEGYEVTAYFLEYCGSLRSGFVADLNAKLAEGWSLGFFNDLLGKGVEEVWSDYKAKYAPPSRTTTVP